MDSHKIYGRVPTIALQKALYWGSLKGFLGLILLPFGGLIFVAGLLLIAWGLIPYRKLKTLSTSPPVITITDEGVTYFNGTLQTFFPLSSIHSSEYKTDTIFLNSTPLPYFSEKSFYELKQALDVEETTE